MTVLRAVLVALASWTLGLDAAPDWTWTRYVCPECGARIVDGWCACTD